MLDPVEKPGDDLPDRMGAMMVKELRQNMRRASFVLPFLVVQCLAIAAMLAEFSGRGHTENIGEEGMFIVELLTGSGPFWLCVSVICIVIMPLGGLALMGQELEDGNHELLLLTRLNRWRVVRGKFFTLWGLCVLTFVSVLPYVIVRYLVGQIEFVREFYSALTLLGTSAMVCAGMIGASSFRNIALKLIVVALYLASAYCGTWIAVYCAMKRTEECGIVYHINAILAVVAFCTLGMALARSRLRLVVHAYEVKPSSMVIGLLVFTPFVTGMATAITFGYLGGGGLLGMALIVIYADSTPKGQSWIGAGNPNIPEPAVALPPPAV